jgi:hypothetical protein
MKNLKTFLVVAGMAVVIVGVGNWMNSPSSDQQAAIAGRKAKATPAASATPAQSYTQLVQKYGNARIQFSQTCQATPAMSTFRNNAEILLDNRSNQAHSVSIGGNTYSLSAYGYQVVTLSSSTLPSALTVNCDKSVNVATIRVSQ